MIEKRLHLLSLIALVLCILSCGTMYSDLDENISTQTFTSGLEFTLINGNTEYSVAIGTANTTGSIVIPKYWNGRRVTELAEDSFSGTMITGITIPDSVITISRRSFLGCTLLTGITIPGSVTSIENDAFVSCTGLTSITIPASVTVIGQGVFRNCTHLTSVTFDGSTLVYSDAFSVCPLTNMYVHSATAPAVNIGAFNGITGSGCTLHIPSINSGYGVAPWTTRFSAIVTDL
jgi:hypothetical protein